MKLHQRLKEQNLISGFSACGISPLNRDEVLKRLPNENRDVGGEKVKEIFGTDVEEIMKDHCGFNKPDKQETKDSEGKGKRAQYSDTGAKSVIAKKKDRIKK